MKSNHVSRRQFLGVSAAAGATLAAKTFLLDPTPMFAQTSSRVRFGIIGIGMRGNSLLGDAIQLPGVECAAACDLYDGRHALAKEIAGANLPTTRRYQDLLDNKDIDCIFAAVPDHWHKQIVIDTLNAGKDVYCEKPFAETMEDNRMALKVIKASDRIVQIGSQRRSGGNYQAAHDFISSGKFGPIMFIIRHSRLCVRTRDSKRNSWD